MAEENGKNKNTKDELTSQGVMMTPEKESGLIDVNVTNITITLETFVASTVEENKHRYVIAAMKDYMRQNNDSEESKEIKDWEEVFNKLFNYK